MIESEVAGQKTFGEPAPAIGYGNFNASIEPTVNDDEEAGYSVNSVWYKATYPYRLWINTSNATGAAVWREIPLLVTSNHTLFDHYTDATTAGTSRETLYTDAIDHLTLYQDGDKIMFRYSGNYAPGINASSLFLEAFGTDIADSGAQIGSGSSWSIEGWVVRVSNTVVRYASIFTTASVDPIPLSGEITGLDLVGGPSDFHLDAETAASPGDVAAISATAWFVPAAPTVTVDELLFIGDNLIFGGDNLIFNP